MYTNLGKELRAKGLSNNAAAAVLGMPEATFRGKMTIDKRSFTVEEAILIKTSLFPELDFFYLFENESSHLKGDNTNE